jgi:hypothetical protein
VFRPRGTKILGTLTICGALKQAVAFPHALESYYSNYNAPLIGAYGKWTALVTDEASRKTTGYLALDDAHPNCGLSEGGEGYSNLVNPGKFGMFKIYCLLILADEWNPADKSNSAYEYDPADDGLLGKLKPLGIEYGAGGPVTREEDRKRYTVCLALKPTGKAENEYRRIGLVEMCEWFWDGAPIYREVVTVRIV